MRTEFAALLLAGTAGSLLAQGWEIGAGGGYGAYRNGSVYAPAGTVTAGVRNRFTLTAWLREDLRGRVSGEVRYTYQDGDPFLESGGVRTNVQGQSHALHYGLLLHLRNGDARLRPYLAVGVGAKLYQVTGPETLDPPFTQIARLRALLDGKPLVAAGAGVELRAGSSAVLRVEFMDYVTPFPKRLIEPVAYATARGFLHQFTPMIGIGVAWRTDKPPGRGLARDRGRSAAR